MKKPNIILVGGGGHCKACIDVIEEAGIYEINGVVDVKSKIGQEILGYKIIDEDKNLDKYTNDHSFLITVGFIKSPEIRVKLFNKLKAFGGNFPVIISPKAQVSKHSDIKQGTIVMHGAVVNADSFLGENIIINNLALIEHDVTVGSHTQVSTGARINGNCKIGEKCFIGSGTVINQGISVCSEVIIGSGSLVRKDIMKPGIYAGNPLKRYK